MTVAVADGVVSVPQRSLPVVAIIGRPNVGKSSLFNRLAHAQRAIVDSQPGVTRDRNVVAASWDDRPFLLVDTGGFEDTDASALAESVRAQSAQAAAEADAVIAVFDGREGLNPTDRDLVERLRSLRKPVFYAVNKLDTLALDDAAAEFFALGCAQVFPISAAHGRGVAELMDQLVAQLPPATSAATASGATASGATASGATASGAPAAGAVTVAIIGRPNVGKSSLLNRLVGRERAIVDATPGTTRDPVDTTLRSHDRNYVLVDTAGIRRRPRVHEHLERASVARALRACERAEVVILVIDGTERMTDQDARIAGYAWERGRAVLIAVNKWDAVPRVERDRTRFLRQLHESYPTLAAVPAVCISARTGAHVADLFPAVERLIAAHRQQLRTVTLNQVLAAATRTQAPPSVKGRRPRFHYAVQTAAAPPTITIFTSAPDIVPTAYERYLAAAFREAFGLYGTPLRLRFRARAGRQRR